jgi:uncharacterized membrane protein
MIFNSRGLPWTVELSLGWTTVLALFSGGTVFLALGLYLAYWVRTRRGGSAAFWCYLVIVVFVILMLAPRMLSAPYTSAIGTGIGVLWVVAALVLRAELISLYRRSWSLELPINLLLTIVFSSVYVNYCVPDLPVAPSATRTPQEAKSAGGAADSGEAHIG